MEVEGRGIRDMGPTVIFSECNRLFWLDVAKRLEVEDGWRISYWVGNPKNGTATKTMFPGVIFHSRQDAKFGVAPSEFGAVKMDCVDPEVLNKLTPYESMIFRMMEGFGLSFRERLDLYHLLVRHWNTVLNRIKPDIFISSVSPHGLYGYVLYLLCCQRNIRTIMFRFTSVPDTVLTIGSIEDEPQELASFWERLHRSTGAPSCPEPSPVAKAYIEKLSKSYSEGMSPILKQKLEEKGASEKPLPKLKRRLKKMLNLMRIGVVLCRIARQKVSLRRHGVPQYSYNVYLRNKAVLYQYVRSFTARRRRKLLFDYYNRVSVDVPLDKPYVYIALHSQPERSTKPDGGIFVDQFFMIDVIARNLPEGWYVYVKEHRGQFKLKNGELARTEYFYRDVAAIPNVRLVSDSMNPFELIDHARAVATVTGTSGWEAVMRGRPAMVFGPAWYKCCEGVLPVTSEEDCRKALTEIVAGSNVNRDDVHRFIAAAEEIGFRGYVVPAHEKITQVSREDNVLAITKAIRRFLDSRKKPEDHATLRTSEGLILKYQKTA